MRRASGQTNGEDKATNELDIIREALEAIRESGRKMSAANRGKVEALKTRLAGLDYHQGVADAIALADELLALDVEPEAEPVTEAAVESAGSDYAPSNEGAKAEPEMDRLSRVLWEDLITRPNQGRLQLLERNYTRDSIGRFASGPGGAYGSFAAMAQETGDGEYLKVGSSKRKGALLGEIQRLQDEEDSIIAEFAKDFDAANPGAHINRINRDPRIKRLRQLKKERQADYDDEVRFSESVRIIEAVQGSKGRQWDVVLITAGKSLNNRTYPADVLRKAAPLFEGVSAYADHPEPQQAGRDRSIRDKVGRFSNVRFDTFTQDGKVTEGLRARLTVVPSWMRDMLVEAVDAGEPDFYGFSINATGKVERGRVQTIESVQSVDVVSTPAAGGRIERLVASVNYEEKPPMKCKHCSTLFESVEALLEHLSEAVATTAAPVDDSANSAIIEEVRTTRRELAAANARAALTEALAGASVTDISKGNIRKRFTALIEAGAEYNAEDVAAAITEASEYEAALSAKFTAPPVFSTTRVEAGESAADIRYKRMNMSLDHRNGGWAKDGVKPYTSIKESYCDFTGQNPFEVSPLEIFNAMLGSRYDSAYKHQAITESLTTASWTDVFVDATYNQMIANYNLASFHNDWRALAGPNIKNVPNFRTQNFTLVGGYGDLSSVAEQATYPTLTSPGDDDMEFAVAKYGGIDDITMETIVNDLIGAIATIPRKMGEAAARTLYKFVFNLVTTDNPTLDLDSTALYIAGHSNTGTAALTLANLAAVRAAMIEQTRYGTTAEILGVDNAPKFLIVPAELEMLAKRIINPSGTYNMSPTADTDGSVDPQAFAGMGMQVLVYPYLSDANNWYAVADPNKIDGLVLGFLGSQEPELFTQDSPQNGSTFSADKISFKVRHIYGGDIADFRPFYRQVVT